VKINKAAYGLGLHERTCKQVEVTGFPYIFVVLMAAGHKKDSWRSSTCFRIRGM